MIRSEQSCRQSGSIVIPMLVIALIASGIALSVMKYASHSAQLTRRSLDYQRARIAAEAGLDYGITQLMDIMREYQFTLSASEIYALLGNLPPPPQLGVYEFKTPVGTSAFKITVDSDAASGDLERGKFVGDAGRFQYFTIISGAYNPISGVGAVLQQEVQALDVSLIKFGVFYEDDLEILPGPDMTFEGRVHCNSDIYLGGPLQFFDKLTAHGNIYHRRKDKNSTPGEASIINGYAQMVSMKQGKDFIDSLHPEWMTQSLNLWHGNVMSGAHGITKLDPPIDPGDSPHALIERPLPLDHPDYNPITEREKFGNKSALWIHVDNAGNFTVSDFFGTDVTGNFNEAALMTNGTYSGNPLFEKETNGMYKLEADGTYTVGHPFFDGREDATMLPIDIYVDQLLAEYPAITEGTTYSLLQGRGVVYVTRDDPDGPGGVIPALRLRNAQELPDDGLSFATDLPVYIEGDFNTEDRKPALVAGDAVTMLSEAWQDARSEAGIDVRIPVSTRFNTVVMTGNSETIPPAQGQSQGTYNGGLENVLRFQENWTGRTLTFRGSIIDLWYAQSVTGPWEYGDYYTAPFRDWGYDDIYKFETPPGMPRIFGIEQLTWEDSTWAEAPF